VHNIRIVYSQQTVEESFILIFALLFTTFLFHSFIHSFSHSFEDKYMHAYIPCFILSRVSRFYRKSFIVHISRFYVSFDVNNKLTIKSILLYESQYRLFVAFSSYFLVRWKKHYRQNLNTTISIMSRTKKARKSRTSHQHNDSFDLNYIDSIDV
jgi:hypothetical protein